MKTWKSIIIAVMFISIGAFGSTLASFAAEEGKAIEQMITAAKTPADHEAIAAHYEKEAQAAHAKHAEHQKMKEWYDKNPGLSKSGFGTHCNLIAAHYDKTGKEYEALAKLHRDMAKAAK